MRYMATTSVFSTTKTKKIMIKTQRQLKEFAEKVRITEMTKKWSEMTSNFRLLPKITSWWTTVKCTFPLSSAATRRLSGRRMKKSKTAHSILRSASRASALRKRIFRKLWPPSSLSCSLVNKSHLSQPSPFKSLAGTTWGVLWLNCCSSFTMLRTRAQTLLMHFAT